MYGGREQSVNREEKAWPSRVEGSGEVSGTVFAFPPYFFMLEGLSG
jgi:hypothetical protein